MKMQYSVGRLRERRIDVIEDLFLHAFAQARETQEAMALLRRGSLTIHSKAISWGRDGSKAGRESSI
ncbi:hypothetical protein SUGI_0102400, partial [Cryptomeria japonica]